MSSELAKIISFSILNGSSKTYLFKENGTLFLNTKITFLSGNSIIPQSFMLEKVIRFSNLFTFTLYNVPNKFEGGTKYGTKRMGKVKKGKCGDL